MFDTFFSWLRRRAAESVLAGVNDAARKLQDENEALGPPLLLVWQPHDGEGEKEKKREKVKAS